MEEKDKVAIIDLGTNTFHLLIAEWNGFQFRTVHRQRVAVKLGMGGMNDGLITDAAIQRALLAVKHFRTVMNHFHVARIAAFGTSALRKAKNGRDVASQLESVGEFPVKIIQGDEEATFIYHGVRAAISMGNQKSLIIDIGGGSVEFIIADGTTIFWKKSIEIGAQLLLERFQKHDPIIQEEIAALNEFLQAQLQPVLTALSEFKPGILVGSSGTFDTLSEIYCLSNNIFYSEDHPETPLTIDSFYQSFELIKSKPRAQRLKIRGMIDMRVDMIVVACCMIDFLLTHHPFEKIRVSTFSLKEGVLNTLS